MRLKYLKLKDRTYNLGEGKDTAITSTHEYRAPEYAIELQGGVVTVTGDRDVLVMPFANAAYALADREAPESGKKGKR